jgi:hypothetical protein
VKQGKKVECSPKLSTWDSVIDVEKRGVGKRERAALSSLPVCTQRGSNQQRRPVPVVGWLRILTTQTRRVNRVLGTVMQLTAEYRLCAEPTRRESSREWVRASFCNGADYELWKTAGADRVILSEALWQLVQRKACSHFTVAAHT